MKKNWRKTRSPRKHVKTQVFLFKLVAPYQNNRVELRCNQEVLGTNPARSIYLYSILLTVLMDGTADRTHCRTQFLSGFGNFQLCRRVLSNCFFLFSNVSSLGFSGFCFSFYPSLSYFLVFFKKYLNFEKCFRFKKKCSCFLKCSYFPY